jgi:hypothetical protein
LLVFEYGDIPRRPPGATLPFRARPVAMLSLQPTAEVISAQNGQKRMGEHRNLQKRQASGRA